MPFTQYHIKQNIFKMKDFKANVYLFENNAANYNTKQRYSFYLEQLINLLYIESFAYFSGLLASGDVVN